MGQAGRKPTDLPLGNNVWSQFQVTEGQEELADVAEVWVGAVSQRHRAGPTVSTTEKELLQHLPTSESQNCYFLWTGSISLTWNLLEM